MKPSSITKLFVLLVVASILIPSLHWRAAAQSDKQATANTTGSISNVISYEGYASDTGGQPLPDGEYTLTFALYTTPAGDSPLWVEVHQSVTIKNGLFQLYLGRGTVANPLDLPFDQPYFLGIRVNNGPEMSPRLELTPTAYSFRAKVADEVPDGSVTTEKLAPLAVTDDKIESVSWSKLKDVPDPGSGPPSLGPPGGVPARVWSLFGNRNSNPVNDYIGTSDARDLVSRTNDVERMRIRSSGEVDVHRDLNVGERLTVEGIARFNDTTQSTAPTSGAVIAAGGVGVGKNLNVGGDFKVDGTAIFTDIEVLNNGTIGGALGIGTPAPSNLKFHVKGQGTFAGEHIALFENTGTGSGDGIAVKVNVQTPDKENNFITFLDANNNARGRIEGQTAGDVLTSPRYIYFTLIDAVEVGLAITEVVGASTSFNVCAGAGAVACPPIASLIVAASVKLAAQAGRAVGTQAFLFGNLGVAYESGAGDYAEYLQRLHIEESLEPGDIVGVFGGRVTKSTGGAQQLMSISLAPIVLGNMPPKAEEHLYEKTAFLGQVPVKVIGRVKEGDYIIPSGREDGTGIAVPPEMMTADEFSKVVGRAWSSSDTEYLKLVNVVVGLHSRDIAVLVRRQQQENKSLRSQLAELNSRFENLNDVRQMVMHLESQLQELLPAQMQKVVMQTRKTE